MKILVTGAAGFIGAAVCRQLLERGDEVVGADNLNDYYPVQLKRDRLAGLEAKAGFQFVQMDIAERDAVSALFTGHRPERVVNLAAQAGVRYSIENPGVYGDANLVGFLNVLEGCRNSEVEHLVYASSSSVYGANTRLPFSVEHGVDHPVSLYAATKKANEMMAHSYSHLYGLPTTGLRYFTVYGPWGRPDMSPFLFVKKIIEGDSIQVFNNGDHMRDFTYIDDIVEGTILALDNIAQADTNWAEGRQIASSEAPYRLYNLGNGNPVRLMEYIEVIEACVGRKSDREFLEKQAGDMDETHADIAHTSAMLGYAPKTSLPAGMKNFVDWYKSYFGISE